MAEAPTRKLAAILAADVVGYSRLMRADETGTLAAMKALWSEVVQPSVRSHRGRVFKLMGDGMLAEFASVVDAANAAEAIQAAANERASNKPKDKAILLRIGINLGDVVVDGADLYGDGVNIAARLQEVAPVGGIAVSAGTYEYLRGKTTIAFSDAGERELKNIDQPVRVWLWPNIGETATPPVARPTPSRSSQPSIAVLPFQNLSSAPDAEFFADGMTEDVINALSKFRWLFVIARGTVFSYKQRHVSTADVARNLGVRFVLEGSVRQAGGRIRVSAQLVETEAGHHLWTERYDRALDDLFSIQDEITNAITSRIAPEIERLERLRSETANNDVDAWLAFQRAKAFIDLASLDGSQKALEALEKARKINPKFAPAIAFAGWVRASISQNHQPDRFDELMELAQSDVAQALGINRQDPDVCSAAGRVYSVAGMVEQGIQFAQEAIRLNPNHFGSYHGLGIVLTQTGQSALAVEPLTKAIQLNPFGPELYRVLQMRAYALFQLGRYEESIQDVERANSLGNKTLWGPLILPISYHRLGRQAEAQRALEALFQLYPTLSIAYAEARLRRISPIWIDLLVPQLRELGVPEE